MGRRDEPVVDCPRLGLLEEWGVKESVLHSVGTFVPEFVLAAGPCGCRLALEGYVAPPWAPTTADMIPADTATIPPAALAAAATPPLKCGVATTHPPCKTASIF